MTDDRQPQTPTEWAEKIAYELNGTCDSLTRALANHDREDLEDNSEFLAALDERVFCCVRCDWWHEQSEMAERDDEQWICESCNDDE